MAESKAVEWAQLGVAFRAKIPNPLSAFYDFKACMRSDTSR